MQRVAAVEVTRPLPSLVEWDVAMQDYPSWGMVLHIGVGLYLDTSAPGHSITGIGLKLGLQSLFEMLGYEHVGAVGPHTFIMTLQVLKTDCNVQYHSALCTK